MSTPLKQVGTIQPRRLYADKGLFADGHWRVRKLSDLQILRPAESFYINRFHVWSSRFSVFYTARKNKLKFER